ncbi:predicted protein [Enterococcus gallinarum EG2]|nr:predicted protein [Enterococcus gallinarum EG2]
MNSTTKNYKNFHQKLRQKSCHSFFFYKLLEITSSERSQNFTEIRQAIFELSFSSLLKQTTSDMTSFLRNQKNCAGFPKEIPHSSRLIGRSTSNNIDDGLSG